MSKKHLGLIFGTKVTRNSVICGYDCWIHHLAYKLHNTNIRTAANTADSSPHRASRTTLTHVDGRSAWQGRKGRSDHLL